MGDHLVRGIQDISGGAIVLLQLDHLGIRIILFKFQDIADIGPAPAINGLIVVADHAQIMGFSRQQPYKLILRQVGVLVLVHMDVAKPPLIILEHRRMVDQQLERLEQQVVKVERVRVLQGLLIAHKNIVDLLTLIILFGLPEPLVRGQDFIFRVRNLRADFLGRKGFFIDVQPLDPVLQNAQLIVVVIDRKGTLITKLFNIPSQNTHADRVECTQPHILGDLPADKALNAIPHLTGRFVGKGKRKDLPGRHLMLKQIRDPVSQRPRFAAPGSGQDQHRALQRRRRFPLHGIQSIQIHPQPPIDVTAAPCRQTRPSRRAIMP